MLDISYNIYHNIPIISHNKNWLVVWNMNFMNFHSVGNVIIPSDELHHFQRGRYTTNQIIIIINHILTIYINININSILPTNGR